MEQMETSELLRNESFLNYCFRRKETDVQYWESWLKDNPQYADEVLALRQTVILLAEETKNRIKSAHFEELSLKIYPKTNPTRRSSRFNKQKVLAYLSAAVALLFVGGYFFKNNLSTQSEVSSYDVAPGGNRATLTLADGKRISLDPENSANLVSENGVGLEIVGDGQLAYWIDGGNGTSIPIDSVAPLGSTPHLVNYNTIETPKGGQFQLLFPDGTKIWLNAASSLTYTVGESFAYRRHVKLVGEAYFEVAPAKTSLGQPIAFTIETDRQHIEVLGTKFNVSSYLDEPAERTTLLEGAVRVKVGSHTSTLRPGQEAVVNRGINIRDVGLEEVVAWKNGMFVFNDEPLESILRKIGRWYDVEIAYDEAVNKAERYEGSFSRYENISHVLRKLELTGGIRFKVEKTGPKGSLERRVWVMR